MGKKLVTHPYWDSRIFDWVEWRNQYLGGRHYTHPILGGLGAQPHGQGVQGVWDRNRPGTRRTLLGQPPSSGWLSYLIPFERETPALFARRIAFQIHLRLGGLVVDRNVAHLSAAKRHYGKGLSGNEALKSWMENVTGSGMRWESFVREVTGWASLFGVCHAWSRLAEMGPPAPEGTVPKGSLVTTIVTPIDLINWRVHPVTGEWLKALIYTGEKQPDELFSDEAPKHYYVELDKENYQIYVSDRSPYYGNDLELDTVGSAMPHGAGKVPLSTFYRQPVTTTTEPIGIGLGETFGPIDRSLLQLISWQMQWSGERAITQMHADEEITEKGFAVSNVGVIPVPRGAEKPGIIETNGVPFEKLDAMIANMILRGLSMAGMSRGRPEESMAARSAEALKFEGFAMRAMLSLAAEQIEEGERETIDIAHRMLNNGQPAPPEISAVRITKKFDDSAVAETLGFVKEALDSAVGLSPGTKAALRVHLEAMIAREVTDDESEIDGLIEEARAFHEERAENQPEPPQLQNLHADSGMGNQQDRPETPPPVDAPSGGDRTPEAGSR